MGIEPMQSGPDKKVENGPQFWLCRSHAYLCRISGNLGKETRMNWLFFRDN